jgi:hypothetical protein
MNFLLIKFIFCLVVLSMPLLSDDVVHPLFVGMLFEDIVKFWCCGLTKLSGDCVCFFLHGLTKMPVFCTLNNQLVTLF